MRNTELKEVLAHIESLISLHGVMAGVPIKAYIETLKKPDLLTVDKMLSAKK